MNANNSSKNAVMYDNKKYKILKILREKKSYNEYIFIKNNAPKLIGVSSRNWLNWLYMPKQSKTEIPYSYLKRIAELLDTTVDELINY